MVLGNYELSRRSTGIGKNRLGKDEWGVFWYINWKEEFDGMGKGAGWGVGVSKIWAMFYWYVWEINQEISSWEQA